MTVEKLKPIHNDIYRDLRIRLMSGEIDPGINFTIRGLASQFGVSMTPVRDATRRLIAEGALTMSYSGRITAPVLSKKRVEELLVLRTMLESELATRALPRVHDVLIDRMFRINTLIEEMLLKQCPIGYLKRKIEFNKALYIRAQAPIMLTLLETVWLQFGPTIGQLYKKDLEQQTSYYNRELIGYLRSKDQTKLVKTIKEDLRNLFKYLF